MKKTLVFIMIFCLLFLLCACGNKTQNIVSQPEEEEIDFQNVLDEVKKEYEDDFSKYAKEAGYDLATIDDVGGYYVSKDSKSMMFESGTNSGSNYVQTYIRAYRIKLLSTVFEKLDVSSATLAKITKTRAIDGTQTDENDKIKLTWTYHPDNGLSIIFEKK